MGRYREIVEHEREAALLRRTPLKCAVKQVVACALQPLQSASGVEHPAHRLREDDVALGVRVGQQQVEP